MQFRRLIKYSLIVSGLISIYTLAAGINLHRQLGQYEAAILEAGARVSDYDAAVKRVTSEIDAYNGLAGFELSPETSGILAAANEESDRYHEVIAATDAAKRELNDARRAHSITPYRFLWNEFFDGEWLATAKSTEEAIHRRLDEELRPLQPNPKRPNHLHY